MGYLHIENLYRDDRIFRFPECYALEKIHGTSAHIAWNGENKDLGFFSGGESHEKFVALFDQAFLAETFNILVGNANITVYGEAYGGKQQGMKETYGDALKFIAFDVRFLNGAWFSVPEAEQFAGKLGLDFVSYTRIPTQLSAIDTERDRPSVQAVRSGITEPKKREGVVLRPIEEAQDSRGNRIITKHKNAEFMETKTPRFVDPDKIKVLAEANAIADEWVTPMRLQHVMDHINCGDFKTLSIEDMGAVSRAMIEDVTREAKGEIVESKEAMRAIGSATARLYKKWLSDQIVVRS